MARSEFNYPEVFAAIGKFIADKHLQDVCVMEFEDGIIVSGSTIYEARGGTHRSQETFVLSSQDLVRLSGRRGLLRR